MRTRRFIQADVFTSEPTKGNGLAVIVDADGLSSSQMQDFAAWTNLAETTFILPPHDANADYRVRIFTPGREMPFAGHPTLGSCAAWLHTGGKARNPDAVVQECAIGLVDIDHTGDVPAFVAPATQVKTLPEAEVINLCTTLEIDPSIVVRAARLNNGPEWQVLELENAETVLAIDSGLVKWPEHVGVSVIGAYPKAMECDYEVRNLSPSSGMSEDPITGSLNAAIAKWMQSEGRLVTDIQIGQGTIIGRKGRVFVRLASDGSDKVFVGGMSKIVIEGSVYI